MSAMLARLAALKAKRAAAAGCASRRVDPALAAAAAAAGAPTRGTWDADYAARLRGAEDGAESDGSDGSDGGVVVLPPPVVRLDPVAQREKWRREMRARARGCGGVEGEGVGEVHAGRQDGGEGPDEEDEDVDEDEDEVEEEVVEGEIEDEDQLLVGDVAGEGDDGEGEGEDREDAEEDEEEKAEEDAEGDAQTGEPAGGKEEADPSHHVVAGDTKEGNSVSAVPPSKSLEDPAADGENGVRNEREDGPENDSAAEATADASRPEVSASGKAALEGGEPKDRGAADGSDDAAVNSGSRSEPASPSAAQPAEKLVLPCRDAPAVCGEFVEDQAEDEDAADGGRDSDRDSDADGAATAADALVADDAHAAPEPGAAVFHREWERREDAALLDAVAGGGLRGAARSGYRPREDDNAMDLTEAVASGAVVAASGGAGEGADGGSVCGDYVGEDGGSEGELMDMSQAHADNYVEEMFRMSKEEGMFAANAEDESADDTPTKEAEEARRSKAHALWKARQKRNSLSMASLDHANLSRCGFLEEDTIGRQDLYRDQIERACGMSNSRDAFASRGGSVGASGSKHGPGSLKTASHSHFAPLQVSRGTGSRSAALDVTAVPEWERRKVCLERKEVHRRSGTSIGKWAFSAERSLGVGSSGDLNGSVSAAPSAPALAVSVRRKRARGQEVSAAVGRGQGSSGATARAVKKPKKSRRSLLSILGSRPTAD